MNISAELKEALEALFKQIVDFVKAIFAHEVPEFKA